MTDQIDAKQFKNLQGGTTGTGMAQLDAKQVRNLPSSSSAQWQPSVTPGVAQATTANLGQAPQKQGTSVSLAPPTLTTSEVSGVALKTSFTGMSQSTQSAGPAVSTVAGLGTQSQTSGGKITQITYTLNGDYGATSVATSGSSAGAWGSTANATGVHDGNNASIGGSLTTAVDGILTLSYAALTNKTALTISSVKLIYYCTLSKGLTGTPTLTLSYSLNGTSYTVLQAVTATNSGPFTFDITSAVGGNWSNLQTVKTQIEFATAAATGSSDSATVDAVELLVVASAIQTP